MTGGRRALRVFVVLSLSLLPSLARAQTPEEQDSIYADSVAGDTVNQTARFLEAQQQVMERVPVMPALTPEGPRPALTRIVFTRDSIEWGHAVPSGRGAQLQAAPPPSERGINATRSYRDVVQQLAERMAENLPVGQRDCVGLADHFAKPRSHVGLQKPA